MEKFDTVVGYVSKERESDGTEWSGMEWVTVEETTTTTTTMHTEHEEKPDMTKICYCLHTKLKQISSTEFSKNYIAGNYNYPKGNFFGGFNFCSWFQIE